MKVLEHSPLAAVVEVSGKHLRFDFRLKQAESEIQPLFSGSAWGTCIWGASVSLSNYVEENVMLQGLKVMEMGAGYGLCGFSAALSGAQKVIVTDKEPEVEYLREGIIKNSDVVPEGVLEVEGLLWGKPEAEKIVSKFGQADVVLAADCISTDVYGRQSWNDLIDTLSIICKPNASVYICSTKRKDDGLVEFIDALSVKFEKHELLKSESGIDGVFEIHLFQKEVAS